MLVLAERQEPRLLSLSLPDRERRPWVILRQQPAFRLELLELLPGFRAEREHDCAALAQSCLRTAHVPAARDGEQPEQRRMVARLTEAVHWR
jgi:hypothetical protein